MDECNEFARLTELDASCDSSKLLRAEGLKRRPSLERCTLGIPSAGNVRTSEGKADHRGVRATLRSAGKKANVSADHVLFGLEPPRPNLRSTTCHAPDTRAELRSIRYERAHAERAYRRRRSRSSKDPRIQLQERGVRRVEDDARQG